MALYRATGARKPHNWRYRLTSYKRENRYITGDFQTGTMTPKSENNGVWAPKRHNHSTIPANNRSRSAIDQSYTDLS